MYPAVRSHTAQQTTQQDLLGKTQRVVASALVRYCRELSRRKAYGVGFSRVEISGVRIGGILGTGAFSKPGTELRLLPYRQGTT